MQFYVSQSTGSDANDGSIGAPWQTLAKLSSVSFVPGDQLFLKRGDTWNETFVPNGTGSFDSLTYSSTYAATYGPALAGYLGGAQFSDAQTDALAAGKTGPVSAAAATKYCEGLAKIDARAAAIAAVKASSTWIELAPYGAGANPIIDGATVLNAGIQFSRVAFGGGWKITDIDIQRCRVVGIDMEQPGAAAGVWVLRGEIKDCFGMSVPSGPPITPSVPGYANSWACAMVALRVSFLILTDVNWHDCDAPLLWGAANDCYQEGCTFGTSRRQCASYVWDSISQTPASNVTMTGCTVTGQCSLGFFAGTSGLLGTVTRDWIIHDTLIETTARPPGSNDGDAIDFESGNLNTFINQTTMSLNAAAGLLCFQNPAVGAAFRFQAGTVIADTIFDQNGIVDPTTMPSLVQAVETPVDNMFFLRTSHVFCAGQTFLFSGGGIVTPKLPLTNTPQPTWIYGPSNT